MIWAYGVNEEERTRKLCRMEQNLLVTEVRWKNKVRKYTEEDVVINRYRET